MLVQVMRLGSRLTGAALLAATASVAVAQDINIGKSEYEAACAVCHGTDGSGHGEFAEYLTVQPSDLTMLSANNDGVFPYLDVFHVVDGRTTVRAHGSQMPVWGNSFTAQYGEVAGPYGAELLIRARIVALTDYVESLQK